MNFKELQDKAKVMNIKELQDKVMKSSDVNTDRIYLKYEYNELIGSYY